MSNEEIKELCDKLNFTYIDSSNESKYISNKKKQTYVRFICNIHQKYGVQEKSLFDLKRLNKPCCYCNHSKLSETFKDEMREINPTIEILSNYVNWNTKIKCRCKIDGYEWYGRPSVLLYGGGCKICGHKKRWDSRGRKTTDDIKKEMNLINPNIEIIGEYKGAHFPIKCRCKLDGKVWESLVCNLLNESATCPTCAVKHMQEIEALSTNEVKKRILDYGLNIELLNEYKNNREYLKCKCSIHNYEYMVSPRTILYNKSSGCPLCTQSMGENKMIQILHDMGYDVVQQHTFSDCKYIGLLRFDAYCVESNIAFEYQGQQHYYPVDFSGRGIEYAQQQYEDGLIGDDIKRKYCKENNIRLIEVPYWEYNNMELFLCNELSR